MQAKSFAERIAGATLENQAMMLPKIRNWRERVQSHLPWIDVVGYLCMMQYWRILTENPTT